MSNFKIAKAETKKKPTKYDDYDPTIISNVTGTGLIIISLNTYIEKAKHFNLLK